MKQQAYLVIEILNDNPVGQINTISNFKSRSKYWGSKYGIADRTEAGYHVLLEANHQRLWCPQYTSDTKYHIGSGNPMTGQARKCGTWRCDTHVWWAFFSQGIDTMPGRIWLPRKLFNFFPYYNNQKINANMSAPKLKIPTSQSLANVTTEDLNNMPYEEFQMIMDAPPAHYVISPSTLQMQFAYDSSLNDVKRGIMIDRLIADDAEKDLVKKLLNLYEETSNTEIKNKIVQGLMLYNQRHQNIKPYIQNEQPFLKVFFTELLNSNSLSPKMADNTIRGFIETHSPDEVIANCDKIDKWLSKVGHYSSIMLKYHLVHVSKKLQPIYIKSIIEELREANNSDLDGYLFGPLSIGYQGSGKKLLEADSKQLVVEYLKEVRHKYTLQGIQAVPNDPHRITTAPYYFELIKNMGI